VKAVHRVLRVRFLSWRFPRQSQHRSRFENPSSFHLCIHTDGTFPRSLRVTDLPGFRNSTSVEQTEEANPVNLGPQTARRRTASRRHRGILCSSRRRLGQLLSAMRAVRPSGLNGVMTFRARWLQQSAAVRTEWEFCLFDMRAAGARRRQRVAENEVPRSHECRPRTPSCASIASASCGPACGLSTILIVNVDPFAKLVRPGALEVRSTLTFTVCPRAFFSPSAPSPSKVLLRRRWLPEACLEHSETIAGPYLHHEICTDFCCKA
jgi:hypothetical protein